MPLYDKSVRELMRDMAEELAPTDDSVITKQAALDWFSRNYPRVKPATVAAHLTRLSTNARSRLHFSAKPREDDILYQIDRSSYRRYRAGFDPTPISNENVVHPQADRDEVEREEEIRLEASEFAYEKDLQNYLSKNLALLEAGLTLYEDEGIIGLEFPAGGRYIDILAVDANRDLVVVELKVSRGYDRVVGQVMRYVGWIKKNLAEENQNVRGVIVAREISEDLLLACSLVRDIALFEYQLSLTLTQVDEGDA